MHYLQLAPFRAPVECFLLKTLDFLHFELKLKVSTLVSPLELAGLVLIGTVKGFSVVINKK